MKKKLKKLMVLTWVAAIFIMPASTALAASDPVVLYDSDEATFIDYLPDPLHVAGGGYHPVLLKDLTESSGDWYVPVGKSFNFTFWTQEPNTTVRIIIYKNSSIVSDYVSSSTVYGYSFDITPEGTNNRWRFLIVPYTDVTFIGYGGVLY